MNEKKFKLLFKRIQDKKGNKNVDTTSMGVWH